MSKKLLIIISVCFLLLVGIALVFKDKFSDRNATKVVLEQAQFQERLIQCQDAIKAYVAFCNSLTFEFGELDV